VSVEAISWALNLAPVPAARGGQPSSPCKFVLVGLANHAGPDGTGAFPSVATLVRYTGLSERTVRTCLDRLQAAGIITPCDPDIVAAWIKRADRRPQGWDLNLCLVRDDPDGVQPLHPVTGSREPVDNPADGVQPLHPAARTGCNQRTDGVHLAQPRGAATAPEPSKEPHREPSAAPARARKATPAGERGRGDGDPAGEFFAALGDAWLLTADQRARLTPAVAAALGTGWSPAELAAFSGANTNGVRNPYAVLAARLSPEELPTPPMLQSVRRPPWCGQCNQQTRRREGAGGADAGRCPACHPLAGNALAAGGGRPRRA
jgi:hypothetical protein